MQKLFQHVSTTRINAGQGKDLSIPISQKPWITMDIQPQKKCAWNTHEYPHPFARNDCQTNEKSQHFLE
jgi:hypothetical protein